LGHAIFDFAGAVRAEAELFGETEGLDGRVLNQGDDVDWDGEGEAVVNVLLEKAVEVFRFIVGRLVVPAF